LLGELGMPSGLENADGRFFPMNFLSCPQTGTWHPEAHGRDLDKCSNLLACKKETV
jgi:hypothetical protein